NRRVNQEMRKRDFGDFKAEHWIDQLTGQQVKYFSTGGGTSNGPGSLELIISCRGGSTTAALSFPRVMYGSYVLRWKSNKGGPVWRPVNPDRAGRGVEIAISSDTYGELPFLNSFIKPRLPKNRSGSGSVA